MCEVSLCKSAEEGGRVATVGNCSSVNYPKGKPMKMLLDIMGTERIPRKGRKYLRQCTIPASDWPNKCATREA